MNPTQTFDEEWKNRFVRFVYEVTINGFKRVERTDEEMMSFISQELAQAVREEREKCINSFYGENDSKSRNLLLKHLKNNQYEQSENKE